MNQAKVKGWYTILTMKKSMHLEVPFYSSWKTENTGGVHCIEMSLKMILGYFEPDKEYPLEALEKITNKKPEKASWEMAYSIWFYDHNYDFKRYSMFDYGAFKKDGIEYIRKQYGNEVAEWQLSNSDIEEAQSMTDEFLKKATIIPKKPTITDIIESMNNGYLVRAAVDSGYLNDSGVYVGHSVVVVGYDDQNILFHDPGPPGIESRRCSYEDFQIAMDKFGSEIEIFKPKAEV